jgi:flavonoid 3'-monooxygenase
VEVFWQGFSVGVAAAGLLAIILVTKLTHKLREVSNLPPGPWGLPILGIMHTLSTQLHEDIAKMTHRFGPLVSFRLGQQLCIAALSPETVMEILKNHDANFANRPPTRVGEVLLPHGMFFERLSANHSFLN